jgi:hypothetical protein
MAKLNSKSVLYIATLVVAILLFACLLHLPYGFYTLIRFITTIICICWAVKLFRKDKITLAVIAVAIALLFQPFAKIYMDKFTWNIVDIIVGIYLLCLLYKYRRHA